ncbi:MAG: DUF1707 SHOCT-like domain-containing protein [Streptosporangiaceae bacterium]
MTGTMKASDADRDAVLSDLSEHFQAGRLTADELDERTGQALAARTWGELRELVADLPATRPAAGPSSGARPRPASRRTAPPLPVALVAIGIAAVLVIVAHGWGFIWLVLPALLIARRLGWVACGRHGHED